MTADCADMSVARIVEAMLGEGNATSFEWKDRHLAADARPVLQVRNLRLAN